VLFRSQLGQTLEQVVAVRRPLAQQEQQRGLGEPLDPGEDAPPAVVVAACAGTSHDLTTCKTHM
jgi:hypothetical protein